MMLATSTHITLLARQPTQRHCQVKNSTPSPRFISGTKLICTTTSRSTSRASHLSVKAMATAAAQKTVSGRFAEIRQAGRVALIPFLCCGDPDLATTERALLELDRLGADIIELGIPYSDPLADGPVIQAAATRSLLKGTTIDKALDLVRRVSPKMRAPLVLFTYYNPILARGLDKFCADIKAAGAAGLLVPDIPLEETVRVRAACDKVGLENILLTTPTTPEARMERIAAATQGFIYLVSVTGVTGVQAQVATRVQGLIQALKSKTNKPIAVGFGVSKGEQALQLAQWGADGVIVGSALVKALGESGSPEEGLKKMVELATSIRKALPEGK